MNDNVEEEVKQENELPQEDYGKQELPRSFIQVMFADMGSVIMPTPPIVNCTSLQALAFAEYLKIMAEASVKLEHNKVAEEKQRVENRKKILVPGINESELLQ